MWSVHRNFVLIEIGYILSHFILWCLVVGIRGVWFELLHICCCCKGIMELSWLKFGPISRNFCLILASQRILAATTVSEAIILNHKLNLNFVFTQSSLYGGFFEINVFGRVCFCFSNLPVLVFRWKNEAFWHVSFPPTKT